MTRVVFHNFHLLEGAEALVDESSGQVIEITTKDIPNLLRWKIMPGLPPSIATTLECLDLDDCRYITSLHESICHLKNLKTLNLTHCDRLASLPENLGNLANLEEVSQWKHEWNILASFCCISLTFE